MELGEAIRRRKMVRSFDSRPVEADTLEAVIGHALHAPSAGNSQGWDFVMLEGPEQTGLFWRITSSADWQAAGDGYERLSKAPVVVLALANPQAYFDRYSEPDKVQGDRSGPASWTVPYWLVDTAFATMLLLLGAVEAGLGALFFRIHKGEAELMKVLGVPSGRQPIGAIALGYPGPSERRSLSLARGQRTLQDAVHWGRWNAG